MQGLVFLFNITGQDLGIVAPGIVAPTCYALSDDDPWIVVAEDTGILLVAFGIADISPYS